MKRILALIIALAPLSGFAITQYKYPVPIDPYNTPIQGALGLPYSFLPTVSTTSYVNAITLPLTGNEAGRQYRSICVNNPDTTIPVYVCMGDSSACSTDHIVVPALKGLCLDNIYYGPLNQVSNIWLKLGSAGSVIPLVVVY